jgi:hypothetical protein
MQKHEVATVSISVKWDGKSSRRSFLRKVNQSVFKVGRSCLLLSMAAPPSRPRIMLICSRRPLNVVNAFMIHVKLVGNENNII